MFDKLRSAFSDAAKSLTEKELNEKDLEDILFELEISLHESDVASEVIDEIKSDLKTRLIGTKVEKNEIEKFVKDSLISTISSLFDTAGKIDIFGLIDEKKKSGEPFLILFVGINGTGKTTSLAKMAYMLQQKKYSVVIAAADTFRAGAIEQLREHTNRLNLKLVAQNYNSDPAAVARDAVLYAKSHKVDCVLIDTAGRMQTSKNLMEQISKISKVVKPDFKIFVGDSLAGNDTVNQAKEFFEHVKFDGTILTKSDADARGGAALSVVKMTSTPVLYVGIGQEYPDLKSFDKETFLETVFGSLENGELNKSEQTPEPEPTPEPESTPEPEPTPEPESTPEPTSKPDIISDDPFEGISDEDISKYSELFDVTPPEDDNEAKRLSKKIKEWINNGKPKTVDKIKEIHEDELKELQTSKDEEQKPDKEETKPKKKRGRFGLFRK
jgi:fused signal recognition particle receptor